MTARQARRAVLVASLLAAPACQSPKDLRARTVDSTAVARETRLERALRDTSGARDDTAPLARWLLPKELKEISGLTLSIDGKLFTHGDELGQIWEIDYRRGVLMKRFSLGKGVLRGDFEGLAIANDRMFLLASNGTLYEFREGADTAHVEYQVHDTRLKKECEFEGVAFDQAINSLVLACKNVYTKSLHDDLVIYRWSLASDTTARLSRLAVPLAGIIGANSWKSLHPSDITVDPLTGNYVLVAAQEKALISITPAGAPVFSRPLPAGHHQTEGVAITKDSILIVSDEAGQRPAMITLYKWPE